MSRNEMDVLEKKNAVAITFSNWGTLHDGALK